MPILNLKDNPGLFDDTVNFHHSYLNDSGVPGYVYDGTIDDTRAKVSETFSKGRDYLLSVTADNIPQGYACGEESDYVFGEESDEVVSIYETVGLYIKPEFRGKGIAYRLKQEQIKFVSDMKRCQWIYSKCHVSNEASRSLLEKLGFLIVLDKEKPWYMGGLFIGNKKDPLYERIYNE